MTASLFLYKCFMTLLADTQLEGSAKWLYLNPWAGDWWVLSCSWDQSSVVTGGVRVKCKSLRLSIALAKSLPATRTTSAADRAHSSQQRHPLVSSKVTSPDQQVYSFIPALAAVSGQLQELLSWFGNRCELFPSICDVCQFIGLWPSQLMSVFILWLLSHFWGWGKWKSAIQSRWVAKDELYFMF